jgi:hypothetical protein
MNGNEVITMQGYYSDKPSKPQYHPDSLSESKAVLKSMKTPDLEYFSLTDKSPRTVFMKYMDDKGLKYDADKLKSIVDESTPLLLSLKTYYNRPRPAQVNSSIKPAPSVSDNTPSYPSGHAFQSYLLARYLTKQHPIHYFSFYRIANRIAKARMSVGLHYPSDNKKAFELAHSL